MYKRLLCFFTVCLSSQSLAIEYCTDSWRGWLSDCTHFTAGAGLSYLAPEPYSNSSWKIDNHWGKGVTLRLGGRISDALFAELSAANLGEASLSNGFSQDDIGYSATALWLGIHLPWQIKSVTPFGKLGAASLSTQLKQGNTNSTAQNSIHIALAAGVRKAINEHWHLRLETDFYTRDARHILAGIEYKIAANKNSAAHGNPITTTIEASIENVCQRLPISIYFHQQSTDLASTNLRTFRKIILLTAQLDEPTLTIKGLALSEEGDNARALANQRAQVVLESLENRLNNVTTINIAPSEVVDTSAANSIESALQRRVDIDISTSGNTQC